MQRRNRPGKRPRAFSFRWVWWVAGLGMASGAVLVLLAPSLVIGYIRAYVQKDDFRRKAEEVIARRSGGSAQIAPIIWNDDNATTADFTVEAPGWSLEAGGVRAALDFSAIRHGTWSIEDAGADDLALRRTATVGGGNPPEEVKTAAFDDGGAIPAFLRRYIPTETRIGGFEARRFLFEQGGWKIAETQLRIGNWRSGEVSVTARLSGGKLQTPVSAPEQREPLQLDIARAALRISKSQIQVSDATLGWKQGSEATLRGSVKPDTGAWQTFIHAKGVPLDEFLDPWWKQRLSGRVEGDVDLSGTRDAHPAWKGSAALKDGALTGLPVLEKLVTYTGSHRFKRIVLDICSATFRPEGEGLRVENIIVQSNGLLRIEGAMKIRGRMVEGDFMLGVTPETLSGIPGAGSRVFVEGNASGPPGLKWTHVHIGGTMAAPQEDLSSRLIGAAGMSLLFDTPGAVAGAGAETLLKPVLGDDAAKVPGKVIDEASKVIESGVNAGAGLINKVLPIFPGK